MTDQAMIEVEGLTRYYGDFAAVADATFSIAEREIVGFLGLNGAGKSTILKVLAGLLMPTAGRVRIGGLDATEAADEMRKRIGFLPEEPPLYRDMRVTDFLLWVGQAKGRTRAQVEAELPRVIELCDLGSMAHKVIDELSHGYRKRVGIAQAVIHKPQVVILDEPISGLDPQQIVEMRSVVQSLKKDATVLISSHILSEIAQTCDRVLVVHEGRIVAEGSENQLAQTLGQGARVTLEVRGESPAVQKVLERAEGIESFTCKASDSTGRVHADVALSETSDAAREGLVAALVKAELGVFSVQDAVSELESVFLELTRSGTPARSPGASAKKEKAS